MLSCLNWSYFISLAAFIMFGDGNKQCLLYFLGFATFMIFLEITQMIIGDFEDYWTDIRNIIDMGAYISMVYFCVSTIWLDESNLYL